MEFFRTFASETFYDMEFQKPEDVIIRHIRESLRTGELKAGMRLPAERKLAEQFCVSRASVRDALKTLETYGIIKTFPQSGSIIVGLETAALDGLLSEVLALDKTDFADLAEMRCILEVNAARLCAARASELQMQTIREALDAYEKISKQQDMARVQAADFHFHRCIAAGSGNMVLRQMLMLITPDIMAVYSRQNVCQKVANDPVEEHKQIMDAIFQHDPEKAANLMRKHLSGVEEYSLVMREKNA